MHVEYRWKSICHERDHTDPLVYDIDKQGHLLGSAQDAIHA